MPQVRNDVSLAGSGRSDTIGLAIVESFAKSQQIEVEYVAARPSTHLFL